MKNALERARAAGGLVQTVTADMPVPGARFRDAHFGMCAPNGPQSRYQHAISAIGAT
jgi:L-lactate dehydrogenase (cytochrome)